MPVSSVHLPHRCLSKLGLLASCCWFLLLFAILHGYLLCLPFSDFSYPLELDFKRLVTELEASSSSLPDGASGGVAWAEPVNAVEFPVLHANPNRCAKSGHRLLMLIKSALPNWRYRAALRATWAAASVIRIYDFQYAFVLGGTQNSTAQAAVEAEQRRYGDIIQQDFIDAYFNNTYKLMFAMRWAATACPRARHVLFADDDYYVSLPNLNRLRAELAATNSPPGDDRLVMGYVFSFPLPKRSLFNKWYTTLSEYPYAFWPPYPTGGAFLVSGRLCRQLSLVQSYVSYLRFDDVFLGILLWKLGVQPRHNSLFHFGSLLRPLTRDVYKNVVAIHLDKDIHALFNIWQAMGYPLGNFDASSVNSLAN